MNMRSVREVAVFGSSLIVGTLVAFGLVALVSLVSKGWAAVLTLPIAALCIFSAAWFTGWVLKRGDAKRRVR